MPLELHDVHQHNDQAMMEAYGFEKDLFEPEIVVELMKMYTSFNLLIRIE